jgi:hypothetical protein
MADCVNQSKVSEQFKLKVCRESLARISGSQPWIALLPRTQSVPIAVHFISAANLLLVDTRDRPPSHRAELPTQSQGLLCEESSHGLLLTRSTPHPVYSPPCLLLTPYLNHVNFFHGQ